MSIIAVRICVLGFPEKENVSHVMAEELLQFPERFMDHVQRCSRELVDSEGILTYMDSDGDACTLTTETLQDALCFLEQGQDMPYLQLVVKPSTATDHSVQASAPTQEPLEIGPNFAMGSQVPCATLGCNYLAHKNPKFNGFCCHGCQKKGLHAGDGRHGPHCQKVLNQAHIPSAADFRPSDHESESSKWDKGFGKGFGKWHMKSKGLEKGLGKKGMAKAFGKAF
jgi:hypothetical protein